MTGKRRNKRRGLTFYQKQKKVRKGLFGNILEYLFLVLIFAFLAFFAVRFFGHKTVVVGDGMEPTLYHSQEVLLNRIIYVVTSPKRGDIVAFLPKGNEKTHYYVKRVIGLPGETVQIKNGRIFIDGEMLDESYGSEEILDPGLFANEFKLQAEEFFVIGDNRNNSEQHNNSLYKIV